MIKQILLTGAVLLTGIFMYAQNENVTMKADKEKELVLYVHKQIFDAIANKMEAPVSNNLQEAFVFTSANADVLQKEMFIKGFVMNPAIKLPVFVSTEEQVLMVENVAIVTAVAHINIIRANETVVRDLWERITGTYIKQGNEWKLLALQATYMQKK
jgi:metal-dependent hydrolase (beta-lactamase superfamily II)